MSGWLAMVAGGSVGAASGAYAAKELAGRYHGHGMITAAFSIFGAALGAGVAARLHPWALGAACLVLLAVALPLSAIDAATRKLPDTLVLPATAACAALLAVTAIGSGEFGPLWRALTAATVIFIGFTTLAVVVPGGLGFGDCKAAALCALPLGYLGWPHIQVGIFAAFLIAAFYILGRRLTGTASRTLAFGPFLFAGALYALLFT
ncbi:prepilin peptidase [Actinospica robiniae]|uniref:prepilin peptidase n=1 Tax=Actinospica robiniae TaxID=304901 RepID=UPI0012F7AE58|nr:prepilin peptidase [Actinospica robiniae]